MARKSLFAREAKRKELYEKYKETRAALKKEGKYDELQALPRNSSLIRQRNRCMVTGRQRAFLRKFGVSRLVFREKALRGELPGVKKASW